jgi:16S rRNA (cytidine1402-2'-O)-methyltransferase
MPGTLFVVATPIGNLEDVTLRALRVLREADLIAAEDTRRTSKLLAHHGIQTPTLSFHQHNIRVRLPRLLARLEAGERVAVVSDAGTPGISDPGVELVRACIDRGIHVEPVPGASAPLAAAMASGFPLTPLTIAGFAPSRSKDRALWFDVVSKIPNTLVFFEAPHRIRRTLTEVQSIFGDRPIVVARELTKVHEELLHGTTADVIGQLTDARGEFTVVLGPVRAVEAPGSSATPEDIAEQFGHMTAVGALGRRGIVSELAKQHGRSSREVYDIIERAKKSVV